MGNIGNGVINTFVDGDVVSANGTSPALLRSALNPKMQIIQAAVDDNDSRIGVLEGQITGLVSGTVQYNVKSSPFNAVGDGIADDTVAIQAAVSAAASAKGVVIFPYGIYKITDTITISGTVSISSSGDFSTATIVQTTPSKALFSIASGGVSISDITLDMYANPSSISSIVNTATVSSLHENVLITRCKFTSSSNQDFQAISLNFCSYVTISSNLFNMKGVYGSFSIKFTSCFYAFVNHNKFVNSTENVIVTRTSGVSLVTSPQSSNINIIGNVTEGTKNANVSLYSVVKAVILGNQFTSKNSSAVYTESTSDGASTVYNQNIIVNGNIIDGQSFVGATAAHVSGTKGFSFSNNIITKCSTPTSASGIVRIYDADNCVFDANLFDTCGASSFYANLFYIGSSSCGNVTVSNNIALDLFSDTSAPAFFYTNYTLTNGNKISFINNSFRRGSKTATYVNSYFFNNGSGSITNQIFISGNDFSLATAFITGTPFGFIMYSVETNGKRTFYTPTGAAPTTGTWNQGDQVLITSPTAGGYIGYVCTTAGTPGTWKGYGAIQA